MAETKRDEWRNIAEAIQYETDSKKLTQLIRRLCEAFDEQERRTRGGLPCNGNDESSGES